MFAVWLRPAKNGKTIEAAHIAIGGITSAPFLSLPAANALIGRQFTPDTINEAAHAARLDSRPLDNTDLDFSWRRAMVEVWVRRGHSNRRRAGCAVPKLAEKNDTAGNHKGCGPEPVQVKPRRTKKRQTQLGIHNPSDKSHNEQVSQSVHSDHQRRSFSRRGTGDQCRM